jgi:hypothetical protein
MGWAPVVFAGEAPIWPDQFKGTRVADVIKVWSTAGHNQVVLPEGDNAITTMNPPLTRARGASPNTARRGTTPSACSAHPRR